VVRTTELRDLKRLFDALKQAGHRQYKVQLRYLHDLMERTPRFRSIFDLVRASASQFDADVWMQEKVFAARRTCHEWPVVELQKLCVLLRIMEVSATNDKCNPTAVGSLFGYENSLDAQAQAFTTHVVFPLIDYLQTRLGVDSEVLHQLERMRRQVEWFEQQELYVAFKANTAKGEDVYDQRVREFLFAEGVDYPFSQPASRSGRADIVAGLEGDDPLVCEVKLYDGDSYGAAYLRQGVGQAVRYARDYGKPASFLAIFNLSDERLQLPSDVDTWPPRLLIEGVTVFLIVVQAKPAPSASKDRQRPLRVFEREQLTPKSDDLREV
jgi:hypothetical protein